MQRLLLDRVGELLGDRNRGAARVGIDCRGGRDVALELAHRRIGATRLAVDGERRGIVEVDVERGLAGGQHGPDLDVDLTDLVGRAMRQIGLRARRARRGERAVCLRGAGSAGEVIALVDGSPRRACCDLVVLQALEERRERGVVIPTPPARNRRG
ncbi:MAG: hypothetical protein M3Q31_23180 [Actinomycetota bacterium]|nr:hypothetical protein [Actinomycetota bacterium]